MTKLVYPSNVIKDKFLQLVKSKSNFFSEPTIHKILESIEADNFKYHLSENDISLLKASKDQAPANFVETARRLGFEIDVARFDPLRVDSISWIK